MEDRAKMGLNRSGTQMSPKDAADQEAFATEMPPSPTEGVEDIAAVRTDYIRNAERIGSVPPPATGEAVLTAAAGKMTGKNPEVLLDKLGQRAAFERSGVRIYQALMTKVEALGSPDADELLGDLRHITGEEERHFHLLTTVLTDLGADPTSQTPSADASGVANLGVMQVITDPRTTLQQCLEVIETIELTDNACWELLIDLAKEAGHEDLGPQFEKALKSEGEHVDMIKKWLRRTTLNQAT